MNSVTDLMPSGATAGRVRRNQEFTHGVPAATTAANGAALAYAVQRIRVLGSLAGEGHEIPTCQSLTKSVSDFRVVLSHRLRQPQN